MSTISAVFEKNKPFIGFLVAGDGGVDYSIKAALAMVKGGVDILEIGMPFSDPVGDGPIIQEASMRALKNKISLKEVLEVVKRIRGKSEVPIVLMGYYNPLLKAGRLFYKKAKAAGVHGMLIVDLPIEEAADHLKWMGENNIDPIFLVTPSTKETRLKKIIQKSKGFIYYACQKGTTGERRSLPPTLASNIAKIKKMTDRPVAVGFGIATRKDAAKVLSVADAFIVGSAFVRIIGEKKALKILTEKAKGLKP